MRIAYGSLLPLLFYATTVNFTSVEKLRTLHIAWLHRKVMVEDFRTQYAFFNGPAIDCMLELCTRPYYSIVRIILLKWRKL